MKFKESSTSLSKACEFINDDFSTGIIDSLIESIVRQSPNKVNTYKDRLLYIESKILKNIELIDENCLELGIDVHKPLKINGFIYPSVYEMVDRFMQSNLDDIFSKDSMILFHGDLTLENIIWDPSAENKYYLIDPNVSSNFNSKESELAKLYQSLKFNYESHKYAEITEIAKNSFLFISHYSNKYITLKNHLDEQLSRRLSRDRLASINMHSVIHLFRILPYLSHEKNKKKFIVLQIIIGLYDLEVNK
jgi:thiamine kinase-like enzyme